MGIKICIVDDESSVIHTVKYGLENSDANFEIIGIENGKKFFEWLEKSSPPDLVLLDIMMPKMNGWEIHRRLQERMEWKDIPVIFLSATADATSKLIGGMYSQDFIEKPFTIPDLKQRIDKVLQRKSEK